MELDLKRQEFTCYETEQRANVSFEITQEVIVPDYCADVSRIVDTRGCVFLQSKMPINEEQLEIGAEVRVSVLFLPEGGEALCDLPLRVPVHHTLAVPASSEGKLCRVSAHLIKADARTLNPRKLLIRAEISLEVCPCRSVTAKICTASDNEEDLQLLEEEAETTVITDILEQEFSYAEELTLSAGRSGIRKILASNVSLRPSETKILGSRLLLKGIARAELLCRDENGELTALQQECIFSHVSDISGGEERTDVRVWYDVVGCEVRVGSQSRPDDLHCITLLLQIRAHIQLLEKKELRFISDLYSLRHELSAQREELRLMTRLRSFSRKQAMREVLETPFPLRDVIAADVSCGQFSPSDGAREGSAVAVRLRCLALDEKGAVQTAEKELTIKTETEETCVPGGLLVRCVDVSAAPASDGAEIRFTLEFFMDTAAALSKSAIVSAEITPAEQEDRPSLVLRKFSTEPSLWEVAKCYRTTGADILRANALDGGDTLPAHRMLLIPRHP